MWLFQESIPDYHTWSESVSKQCLIHIQQTFFSISCFCFGVCDSVLHFVFFSWVSFCLIFWDIRHSGLVGDSILDLFVFPFGDSVFLFGIFVSQSRLTLGYHFPFWLCVFLCGVSGLCFRVLLFCFCSFRPPHLCTMRKTCH